MPFYDVTFEKSISVEALDEEDAKLVAIDKMQDGIFDDEWTYDDISEVNFYKQTREENERDAKEEP